MTSKKHSTLLLVIIALIMSIVLVACTDESPDKTIEGVTFEDLTVDYDGNLHTITVKGVIPQGVKVNYSNNSATEAGEYFAYATLYGKGYETITLFAKLTIVPPPVPDIDIVGVTFDDQTVFYDEQPHEITVSGALPQGVTVSYNNNVATDVGEYTATATLSGEGYNTLILTAKLTIELAEADITGITLDDLTVDFNGDPHELTVAGKLPQGVNVTYDNNVATEAGEYTVTATFTQTNRKDVVLTATLTINAVDYVVVNNSEELLTAANNGGLVLLGDDITLDNGEVVNITKDAYINGRGHTLTAVGYKTNYGSDYRVINVHDLECGNVTIANLTVVANESVPYLRGINIFGTQDVVLNVANVDVKLCDYYAFNILGNNVNLTVNMTDTRLSAWAAVYNRASGMTFNADNCVFEGTNIHISANGSGNYFSTFIVSEYILLNDETFIAENLSANNIFTLTDCEIISKVAIDVEGEFIDTMQKLVDIRSPYNNRLELIDCTFKPVYYEWLIYSAYDSEFIPDEHRDDPDYVVNTNKIIIDDEDVTDNGRYVEKYLDQDE